MPTTITVAGTNMYFALILLVSQSTDWLNADDYLQYIQGNYSA
jgi:uncharacterized membrane protein (DUF485 family)